MDPVLLDQLYILFTWDLEKYNLQFGHLFAFARYLADNANSAKVEVSTFLQSLPYCTAPETRERKAHFVYGFEELVYGDKELLPPQQTFQLSALWKQVFARMLHTYSHHLAPLFATPKQEVNFMLFHVLYNYFLHFHLDKSAKQQSPPNTESFAETTECDFQALVFIYLQLFIPLTNTGPNLLTFAEQQDWMKANVLDHLFPSRVLQTLQMHIRNLAHFLHDVFSTLNAPINYVVLQQDHYNQQIKEQLNLHFGPTFIQDFLLPQLFRIYSL